MSDIKIQPSATGSGTVTITAPTTNTARVITLPDSAGTLLDENSSVPAANLTGTIASARLPTSTDLPLAGGTMTGDTLHGDNIKSTFGAGNDLEIYHQGGYSYIHDNGTGPLYIRATDLIFKSGTDNDDYAKFIENGAAELYYSNAKKFETTATGFKLTGTAGTSPLLELNNADAEDNDTGRESSLRFTGKRSGGEAVINAQISGHHDGSADDDKGMMLFYTNGGSGSVQQLKITSDGRGLSQFTAKAWVNFNGSGTPSIRQSHNVSSITDAGVGRYDVNFSNNLADASFAATMVIENNQNQQWIASYSTSKYRINIYTGSNYVDDNQIGSIVFGN